jgi:hypothetical protein
MPRHLTAKQKKIIDNAMDLPMGNGKYPQTAEDLDLEVHERLEKINDFETIYQAIDNYMWDRIMNNRQKLAWWKRANLVD